MTAAQDLGRGVFTRINEVWPEAMDPVVAPSVTLDFGKVVVGYPKVDFAWASDNHPGVRLAFSETLQYLTDRSDFTRADQAGGAGQGTDQYAVPAGGASWTDRKGYGSDGDKVYADGLHGFRYLKITLDALPSDAPAAQPWGTVAVDAVSLDFTAYVGTPDSYRGWFLCSDEELNRYWYGASYTNELVVDTFRKDDVRSRATPSAPRWTASWSCTTAPSGTAIPTSATSRCPVAPSTSPTTKWPWLHATCWPTSPNTSGTTDGSRRPRSTTTPSHCSTTRCGG